MLKRSWIPILAVLLGGALWFGLADTPTLLVVPDVEAAGDSLACPETSSPTDQSGAALEAFADNSGQGVVYDSSSTSLKLQKQAGLFKATNFSVNSKVVGICSGDFDGDGWVDFIGASDGGADLAYYRNITFENQRVPNLPDWDDPDYRTTPKFAAPYYMEHNCRGENGHPSSGVACSTSGGGLTISCADFNQDGNMDFFYARSKSLNTSNVYVSTTTRADIFLGRGDGTFNRRYRGISSLNSLNYLSWSTDSTPYDYNGDSFPDLVIGHSKSNSQSDVHVYVSDGNASQPKLVRGERLVGGSALGKRGALASTFGDMNGDGHPDLVVSGPTEAAVWFYEGLAGGGLSNTRSNITSSFRGGATTVVTGDFSLDGKPDILVASDNWNYNYNRIGGHSAYWRNNGTGRPFSGGVTQETSTRNNPYYDFDVGAAFDYDNDPDGTLDVIIADGNHSAGYLVLANRTVSTFPECGEVQSGVLELGDLEDEEMVVTGARLTPDVDTPFGTSVTFFMSNEEPANWFEASPCVDDSSAYCVAFPRPVGRAVRWKAEMCSNGFRTRTPTISGVEIGFDYTVSKEHYRAGVVVSDGVAYVGAFRQPGARGHFYATNAGLTETYWDLATKLDATSDSDRSIYTATIDGTDRIDFETSNSSNPKLKTTLGVGSSSQAYSLVEWQRSARFGVAKDSRLGAIENSTPAVVGAPGRPIWYGGASPEIRSKMDKFIRDYADRKTIVLVGSKDGAIHAVRNDSKNIRDAENGTEAWAFIPARVARGFLQDQTNDTATSYPDGSPTVGDVVLSDGEIHTVALISGGAGSRGVTALDITETITESGRVVGPTPLWEVLPGGASAGHALSKPVMARVTLDSEDRFIAILATGRAPENPSAPYTKGRDVIAVDMSDGHTLWQFQSECPITSDIVVFETDDDGEAGEPTIDGYIDRVMWADACGNLYKVNPGQDLSGAFMASSDMGDIATGHVDPDGNLVYAVFSTDASDCGLGVERPIHGTLGARSDASGRFTLFFGTGGSEDYDPTLPNAFYAVYANTGEVRGCAEGTPELGRIEGRCTSGVCEKFYGGVVVTSDQLIVTRSIDPPIGTGTCEFGESEVTGLNIGSLDVEFSVATAGATVSSLYGDAGAVYFSTISGEIVRIGDPGAANAGEGSVGGTGSGSGGGSAPRESLDVLGWRVIQ